MNNIVVFVLLLCLVGALSLPAASAPVESTIISPSVSAQPMETNVPDSLGASYQDFGRAASFRANLEENGFIVTSGQMTPIDPIVDLLDSGIGDSANGNNAGQPYKVLMVPISPSGKENPLEWGLTIFRLRPDEAVVYLGPTPPPCDYFSFTVFLWVRHKDSLVPKGDWMVAAVNDPLNNALIKTEDPNGTPFRKQTIVIFTADKGVYERMAALAQEAGYPESMINPYVIPSGLLNLGVLPETPLADSFIILVRTANFVSKFEGDLYLSDDHYARVWRVTPESAPALDPFLTPGQRVRTGKSESELYPDLNNGLERLENAILAQTPHVQYESYESIRWFAESREVLEETDPGSPLYHKFVAGEASDTPYLRTSLSGEAANFTLGSDDMVVVYGVNHAATGLATYSNFGVYGDWVTSSCQDNPWQYVFGCGDRSWNGVVSMTNHVFSGSAEEYIPGDPMAPYLYAVKVLRQPPEDPHDKYFVVVPTATPKHPCASPGYCLGLNDPIIIGYRAYLNPATASGAAYEDIIHDRAIWFRLRESPGPGSASDSGSLYVASLPSGATILINGTDFGTTNSVVRNVPAGNQNLTLTKTGYHPETIMVDVPERFLKVLDPITLTREGDGGGVSGETGTLSVSSYPAGATILINGTEYGTTNSIVKNVPAGNQNLTLVKEGYQSYSLMVDVPERFLKVLDPITLTREGDGGGVPGETGTLSVASYPKGATIFINGTEYGTTNAILKNVPAGNQILVLMKEGYEPYGTEVDVPVGFMKILDPVTLTPGTPPGATVYPGTLQRCAGEPCYTLTYTDAYNTFTVFLRPHQITPAEGGSPLPDTIPEPVAVDYVGPIDYSHYTLDFRYQGISYSAPWSTSCQAPVPSISGTYKPIKEYNDYVRLYEYKWYVEATLTWTTPQEPMPVKAQLDIYYTSAVGTSFLTGSSVQYPYLEYPINPPLVTSSSWLSTECPYGPSTMKMCDNPYDFSPYTAVGTVWDSYGNAFTVTTTLVPA